MKQLEKLERLLFVSRVREPGDEARARLVAEQSFPQQAFEEAGLVGFTLYVGGGYCIFEFGFDGPFEPIFERLHADPVACKFFEELERYVEPAPRIEPGATGGAPLAADVFMWRSESGVKARESAR
jgi:hypothetical protein